MADNPALDERLRAADPLHAGGRPPAEDAEASLQRLLVEIRGLPPRGGSPGRWTSYRPGAVPGRPTSYRPGRVRRRLVLGTVAAGVAVCATLALLLGSAATPPAFAVTRHSNGTITVRIIRLDGISGANRRLRGLGVPARLVASDLAGHLARLHPCQGAPSGTTHTITINPAAIPHRRMLVIGVARSVHLAHLVNVRLSPRASRTVRLRARALAKALAGSPRAAARLRSIRPMRIRSMHQVRIYCAGAGSPPAG